MIAKWFQICNFRSIEDSGKCPLSLDNITILAGKTESGKSNVIDALEKFDIKNSEEFIKKDDKPLFIESGEKNHYTTVTIGFEIDGKEIIKNTDSSIYKSIFEDGKKYEVSYTRSQENPSVYFIGGKVTKELDKKIAKEKASLLDKINRHYNFILAILSKKVKVEESPIFTKDESEDSNSEKFKQIIDILDKNKPNYQNFIKKEQGSLTEIDNRIRELIDKYESTSTNYLEVLNKLANNLPSVVVYRSFLIKTAKFKAPISTAIDNPIIKDFCTLSGLNLEKASKLEPEDQERVRMFNRASRSITRDFGDFWTKDKISIRVHDAGDKIQLFIYDISDDQTPFKPEQRSDGLLWFLGFYLRLQVAGKKKNNIIIIDEPGLYLHATAQKSVLSVLESLSKDNTIIFSTHMPYLIDPNHLSRIRLVLKDTNGKTRIEKSVSDPSQTDALTPIITAIGLDASGSSAMIKKNNVLLEGISDYYLIRAMEEFLQEKDKTVFPDHIGFIPSVGCTNIPILVSLCIGWGLDYLAIVDNDKQGKKTYNELLKEGIPEEKIYIIHKNKDYSIEDLFSKIDYRTKIAKVKCDDEKLKNSSLAKKCEQSKSLNAVLFYGEIKKDKDKIKLEKETKDNFKDLFKKINDTFKTNVNEKIEINPNIQ